MSEPNLPAHPASIDTETWITGRRTAIVARIPVAVTGSNGKPLRFTIVRLDPEVPEPSGRQVRVT